MPGPGPHMMYAIGSGLVLTTLTNGRFSPHHTLIYTVNSFFGPDIGSFTEWLASLVGGFGSELADAIHHPFYYVIILGLPLCVFYSELSSILLLNKVLDSFPPVPLTKLQCILLISAGSLSHFFLITCSRFASHVYFTFQENGHSSMYTWILSTGWWEGRAPINPDAVIVVGALCIALIGGFIYINRVRPPKSFSRQPPIESCKLIIIIATLYCFWCASQIYLVNPRQPAVGEEADLGVLVFLATYFFFPFFFVCILSMHSSGHEGLQLPK